MPVGFLSGQHARMNCLYVLSLHVLDIFWHPDAADVARGGFGSFSRGSLGSGRGTAVNGLTANVFNWALRGLLNFKTLIFER